MRCDPKDCRVEGYALDLERRLGDVLLFVGRKIDEAVPGLPFLSCAFSPGHRTPVPLTLKHHSTAAWAEAEVDHLVARSHSLLAFA